MAPQSSAPPSLPPSVEEAYRRKCVQLKNRTNEVEEANDAARLRLTRIKRQVEKLRIERAFLLEQMAKRTSTNVEDSDGSPSPPPTEQPPIASASSRTLNSEAGANPGNKPKEKPLRVKRGHRKTSATDEQEAKDDAAAAADDPEAVDKGAFELFAKSRRTELEEKTQDDQDMNVDEELERSWKELPEADKEKYYAEFKAAQPPKDDDDTKKSSDDKAADDDDAAAAAEDAEDSEKPAVAADPSPSKEEKDGKDDAEDNGAEDKKEEKKDEAEEKKPEKPEDEDVEMGGNDTEEREKPATSEKDTEE